MKKVILTKGLPGSGKTTWALELMANSPNSYKRVNKDALREMLDNSRWSRDAEKLILKIRDSIILSALEDGKHVIVDDTNLAPKHQARIEQLVRGLATVETQDFTDVPIETCIANDLKRLHSVGEKVIRDMHKQFLQKSEEYTPIDGLPWAVICDIDGTLALHNGRDPYDCSTCENDILNKGVASVASAFEVVILVSGRESKWREKTEAWLSGNAVKYKSLYMRQTDDKRKDWIVKREIFENEIRPHYNIRFVLDDRNRVVDMWRSLGLSCLQVADGDF